MRFFHFISFAGFLAVPFDAARQEHSEWDEDEALKTGEPAIIANISFVATSNKEAQKAQRFKGRSIDLQTAFFQNAAFKKAFEAPATPETLPLKRPSSEVDLSAIKLIRHSGELSDHVYAAKWGLVSAIVEAYNEHHELVLRPDDLWQAILTQFSFYINANSETLREKFVDFEGKKQLVIVMDGSLETVDYGQFARWIVDDKIVANIKDPEVVQWLIPNFSTTTEGDRVAASVTVMSTLQAYFQYIVSLRCGIPKVTLLGSVQDWKELANKADRLPLYDAENDRLMTRWHSLLKPVLEKFVESAAGNPDLYFWDRVASHSGGGSGPSYLSGWVTVFAALSKEGKWADDGTRPGSWQKQAAPGMNWPLIDTNNIAVGAIHVPVLIDDRGIQYDTQMIAGQVAFEVCGPDGVALRPRTDWCIAGDMKPRQDKVIFEANPDDYRPAKKHSS